MLRGSSMTDYGTGLYLRQHIPKATASGGQGHLHIGDGLDQSLAPLPGLTSRKLSSEALVPYWKFCGELFEPLAPGVKAPESAPRTLNHPQEL